MYVHCTPMKHRMYKLRKSNKNKQIQKSWIERPNKSSKENKLEQKQHACNTARINSQTNKE